MLILLSFSLHAMDINDVHYQTYKKRFPQTRKSYKKYSNDEQLFVQNLEQEVAGLKKRVPDIFNGEVKIFKLGCHDGDTSKQAVQIVHTAGAHKISFHGIDPYDQHVQETTQKLSTLEHTDHSIEKQDLDTYQVHTKDINSAHIILVEQICHHVKNPELFIKKILQLAAPQSIVIFGHTDDSASTVNQLFNRVIGGTKYITTDVCPKIKTALKKEAHQFIKKTVKQQIHLPKANNQTWKRLQSIKDNYQDNYKEWSNADLEIKNILEFCATQPLEKLACSNGWLLPKN